jgi:hypothetical protein
MERERPMGESVKMPERSREEIILSRGGSGDPEFADDGSSFERGRPGMTFADLERCQNILPSQLVGVYKTQVEGGFIVGSDTILNLINRTELTKKDLAELSRIAQFGTKLQIGRSREASAEYQKIADKIYGMITPQEDKRMGFLDAQMRARAISETAKDHSGLGNPTAQDYEVVSRQFDQWGDNHWIELQMAIHKCVSFFEKKNEIMRDLVKIQLATAHKIGMSALESEEPEEKLLIDEYLTKHNNEFIERAKLEYDEKEGLFIGDVAKSLAYPGVPSEEHYQEASDMVDIARKIDPIATQKTINKVAVLEDDEAYLEERQTVRGKIFSNPDLAKMCSGPEREKKLEKLISVFINATKSTKI